MTTNTTPVNSQGDAPSLHDEKVRYRSPHEVIKNYALEICQLLFSDPAGRFLWDIDQAKTQITICDKHSFNLAQVNQQPCIVASRGPLAWMTTSGFQQRQDMDWRTGRETFTDLIRGGVTLSCFSVQGIEAEDIAGFLFEGFQMLRPILRKIGAQGRMVPNHLGFFRIQAATMGEEALVRSDSGPDMSVVPVAISANVQRRWSVEPKARTLLKINANVTRKDT